MVGLKIQSVTGIPAFKLSVAPTDTMMAVTKAAARKAHIVGDKGKHFHNHALLRLSRGKHWLDPKDSVEALGMKDGTVLMLHVRNQPLNKVGVMPGKLVVHSFSAAGYGIFVDVATPAGRVIWRPKLFPHEDVGKLIEATARKAGCKGITLKYKRHSGETVKLAKGNKVGDYALGTNDVIVAYGLPEEEEPVSSPRPNPPFRNGSFNALTRPGSAPATPTRPKPFLPVGATNWP